MIACAAALALAPLLFGPPQEEPPPVGFAAMERLDLLPVLPPDGTLIRQTLPYDTTGGNFNGFGKFIRGTDARGDWVIFDEYGPGCLYRQQMNVWCLGPYSKKSIDPAARRQPSWS